METDHLLRLMGEATVSPIEVVEKAIISGNNYIDILKNAIDILLKKIEDNKDVKQSMNIIKSTEKFIELQQQEIKVYKTILMLRSEEATGEEILESLLNRNRN